MGVAIRKWCRREEHERTFWNDGNIPYLILSSSYVGVDNSKH
jgi:hypothetical protein